MEEQILIFIQADIQQMNKADQEKIYRRLKGFHFRNDNNSETKADIYNKTIVCASS